MTNECPHDGNLKGLCANCIRRGFMIEIGSRAIGITLSDIDCKLISETIDQFCTLHDSFYNVELDDDLIGNLDERFQIITPLIVEFINIYLFG